MLAAFIPGNLLHSELLVYIHFMLFQIFSEIVIFMVHRLWENKNPMKIFVSWWGEKAYNYIFSVKILPVSQGINPLKHIQKIIIFNMLWFSSSAKNSIPKMKSCWNCKFVLEIPFGGFGNVQLFIWLQTKQLDQHLSSREHEQEQREGKNTLLSCFWVLQGVAQSFDLVKLGTVYFSSKSQILVNFQKLHHIHTGHRASHNLSALSSCHRWDRILYQRQLPVPLVHRNSLKGGIPGGENTVILPSLEDSLYFPTFFITKGSVNTHWMPIKSSSLNCTYRCAGRKQANTLIRNHCVSSDENHHVVISSSFTQA